MFDITIEPCGSITLLRPNTEAGELWIAENCASEDWQWLGGALAVEPRMTNDIHEGALDAGLEVDVL